MKEKLTSQFVGTGQTKNRMEAQPKNEPIITGVLTSRIEKRAKHNETYYYGFFKTEGYEQEIPVILG